ncbi:MAG TPA: RagB/SusD family nutrient uptake outer membrane protein [Puia sp.]|nr:RagB/SusD family nutrient uptake outer membrane protein [Puia sp.]
MKKTLYYIFALLALASCQKDFKLQDNIAVTTQSFWKTASDAQEGVNAIYSTYHREGLSRWHYFMTMIRADEGYSTSPNADIINTYDAFNITDYTDYLNTSVYQDDYMGINRCNQVLDNVPDINMDANLKKQLIGEAYFNRGFFYYDLATIYGNVPIMRHTSKPTDYPATMPQDSIFAQAAADFTAATTMLPNSYDVNNVGRATAGAAYAMLGKTYMQQHVYDKAAAAFAWLITGPGAGLYKLVPNYRSNFIETSENNSESVFEWQNALNPADNHDDDTHLGSDVGQLNYGTSIPPFFAPAPIGFTDGQARRWPVWEFLQEKTTSGGRDPRLAATFLYDSTDVRGPAYTLAYGKTWSSLGLATDPSVAHGNTTEVCFRKELDDSVMTGEVFHSGNNYRYLRYADVLLLYAEALNAQGQTTAAYPYVDMVRERAGLAPLSTAKPGLDQADFLTQLKHERITELTGEGHRWEDLARWGDLGTGLAGRDPGFANFKKGRDEFMPIPRLDLDINPNLKQNPGY